MSIPLSDHVTASSLGSLKFPPSPPHNRHEHELSSLTKPYDSCHHQQHHHHLNSKGLGGTRISQVEITSFYSPANSLYEPDGSSTIASSPPMSGIQQINGSSSALQPSSTSRVLPLSQSTIAPLCLQCKGQVWLHVVLSQRRNFSRTATRSTDVGRAVLSSKKSAQELDDQLCHQDS